MGDAVAFYELLGQGTGRQAVVGIARVSGAIEPNTNRDKGVEEGDRVWEWEFPCSEHQFGGIIERHQVYEILGWNQHRPPLIAGGVVEITAEQFDQLQRGLRQQ